MHNYDSYNRKLIKKYQKSLGPMKRSDYMALLTVLAETRYKISNTNEAIKENEDYKSDLKKLDLTKPIYLTALLPLKNKKKSHLAFATELPFFTKKSTENEIQADTLNTMEYCLIKVRDALKKYMAGRS